MVFLWDLYATPMGFLWGCLCGSYDMSMGLIMIFLLLNFHGISMGFLWCLFVVSMIFLWDLYGNVILFLWDVYVISLGLL